MEIRYVLLKKARNEAVCINCKKIQRNNFKGREKYLNVNSGFTSKENYGQVFLLYFPNFL